MKALKEGTSASESRVMSAGEQVSELVVEINNTQDNKELICHVGHLVGIKMFYHNTRFKDCENKPADLGLVM
jgi:hypothetical protein